MLDGWWIADYRAVYGTAFVVSWLVWVVLSVVLHELSHGWVAMRLGDDTPRATGHMTWNPLVHMGTWSLAALALIGIAWGAMPVDPTRVRGRHGDAVVALAGPAMNILLFVLSVMACVVWVIVGDRTGIENPLYKNFAQFFVIGAFLNLLLAAFNMIPAPPLDGSRVLMSFMPWYRRFMYSPNGQWVGLGVFILFFWFGGEVLYGFAISSSLKLIDAIVSPFGAQLGDALQWRFL